MKLWIPLSISFIIFSASVVYLYHQWTKVEEEAIERRYFLAYLTGNIRKFSTSLLEEPKQASAGDEEKDSYGEQWNSIFHLRVYLQNRLINKSIQDVDYKKQKEELINREDSIVERYIYGLQKLESELDKLKKTPAFTKQVPENVPSKKPEVTISPPAGSSPSSTSVTSLLVPIGGLIISAFTFASTFFFSWRTDRRNEKESQLKIIQLQQELASRDKLC